MIIKTASDKGFKRCLENDRVYRKMKMGEYHVIRLYTMNVDPQILALFISSIDTGTKKLSRKEFKLLTAPEGILD